MMLRVYFLQQWFNLSDPGAEEALYDSSSMRRFAGIDLGEMPVPDESTVLRFRHLLETHGLGEKLFQQVHAYLEGQGMGRDAHQPGASPLAALRAARKYVPDAFVFKSPSSVLLGLFHSLISNTFTALATT